MVRSREAWRWRREVGHGKVMNYEVRPQNGRYLVIVTSPGGLQTRIVTRDKVCSCGSLQCAHVRAVRDYLVAGGERAQEYAHSETVCEALLSECPICGRPIVYGKFMWSAGDIWHCEDLSHYWLWRAEQKGGAAREFMCSGRPTGIPGIDGLKGEYREWLDRR